MAQSADISIIIPTVDGRKDWLRKTVEAYKNTAPEAEIIIMTEYGSCGAAWMEGWEKSSRPYVHFTADDIIPYDNWWQEATEFLDRGIVPVCRIIKGYGDMREEHQSGVPCGALGHPRNVMVPFLTREMLLQGGWLLPIHYGSDSWVSYWAVKSGYPVEVCLSYVVTHYLAPQGRVPHRQLRDMQTFILSMEEAGYLPPYWDHAKRKFGLA